MNAVRNRLELNHLCWIDYETTGVNDGYHLPIEFAAIITDSDLNEIDRGGCLINWPILAGQTEWLPQWSKAAMYHGLYPLDLLRLGLQPMAAAEVLYKLVELNRPEYGKVILISDNIQFEWRFTKQLLAELTPTSAYPWPFHYCGWDTSVLTIAPGIDFEDPKDNLHRAMPDVEGLLDTVRSAFTKALYYFPKWEGLAAQQSNI